MLDPRQLLPALVRFGEPDTQPAKREQVLKYVAFAMEQLRCRDRCALCGFVFFVLHAVEQLRSTYGAQAAAMCVAHGTDRSAVQPLGQHPKLWSPGCVPGQAHHVAALLLLPLPS